MKTVNKKLLAIAVVGLSGGTAHADGQAVAVEVTSSAKKVAIQELVATGFLLPTVDTSRFAFNKAKTLELFNPDAIQQPDARHTMDLIQSLVGDQVDVRSVDVIEARFGSQDISVGK